MSHRLETLMLLYREVSQMGEIVIRSSEYKAAQSRVFSVRRELEEARLEFLRMDLARFYRVALFGGSKFSEEDEEFRFTRRLAYSLVKEIRIEGVGIDIVTGGGPGIMRAAHEGTLLAIEESNQNGEVNKSKNLGINIDLSSGESSNGLAHISTKHAEFPPRLQEFLDRTRAAYNGPGGIGTLLELAMVLQLKQVGHLEKDYPVIAHPFWLPVIEAWNTQLYRNRGREDLKPLINPEDLNIIEISDCIDRVVELISRNQSEWYYGIRKYVKKIEEPGIQLPLFQFSHIDNTCMLPSSTMPTRI